MADTEDNQRTEQPSQRKLQRARSQGQLVQSREINSWIMLATGSALALLLGPALSRSLQHTLARFLEPASLLAADGVRWEAVRQLLLEVGAGFVVPAAAIVAAGLAGSLLPNGLVLAVDRIGVDFSRLSPARGFARLFSLRAVGEFVKSLAKVAGISALVLWMLAPELDRLPLLSALPVLALPAELLHLLRRLAIIVLVALAVIAAVDYGYQRLIFLRSMRMSRQEVKEEHKQAEGDPTVKARLRQLRMERARKRMMAAVPTASVVVTNPTHYAVALKYQLGDKGAPKLVAKGADLIAQRIREVAAENGVPLVENPPLARSLYASVDLDQEIPPEHYRAVAEVINYVFRLKGKVRPR
ncbi:MAG TPA: flagellar biosynthesis protein FlhB [Stellaceae bacterium]|nr:flagellar biosynthesis protein FlhB [Stellaceae bacterium]